MIQGVLDKQPKSVVLPQSTVSRQVQALEAHLGTSFISSSRPGKVNGGRRATITPRKAYLSGVGKG